MEINLSIQRSFASGSRLMVIIHIHLMFYLLECTAVLLSLVLGNSIHEPIFYFGETSH